MPQPPARESGDHDPSSHSSFEPSFYSDPFKNSPVKALHRRGSTAAKPLKQQEVMPSSSPRPYPVSIRAYNRRDYEYIASFSRSLQAGLRATRSEAELLQHKAYNTDIENDLSSMCSMESRTSESSAGCGNSTGTPIKFSKDVMQMGKQQQQRKSAEIRSDIHDHLDKAQLAQEWPEFDNGVKEEAQLLRERKEYLAYESFRAQDNYVEAVGNHGCTSGCGTPVEMRQRTAIPEFGAWNREASSPTEAYTDIFDQLREEKRGEGLSAQEVPPHLQTPVQKLTITKIPRHAATQHRKWSSSSWSLCFVAPVTIE